MIPRIVVVPLVAVSVLVGLAIVLPGKPEMTQVNVAFVGNSIQYVNDVPRTMEYLAGGYIEQNSCLHGSLSFMSIMLYGNGMYNKYRRKNGYIGVYNDEKVYDWGACSVPQLMYGHDEGLATGYYRDDGKNPCLQSANYLDYLEQNTTVPTWEFVVLNDQTRTPVYLYSRHRSLVMLRDVFVPILRETGATPVLLMTHAYNLSQTAANPNSSAIQTVPAFTSHLWRGYRQYAKEMKKHGVAARIAPAGLAFLVVWEEDRDLWKQLFSSVDLCTYTRCVSSASGSFSDGDSCSSSVTAWNLSDSPLCLCDDLPSHARVGSRISIQHERDMGSCTKDGCDSQPEHALPDPVGGAVSSSRGRTSLPVGSATEIVVVGQENESGRGECSLRLSSEDRLRVSSIMLCFGRQSIVPSYDHGSDGARSPSRCGLRRTSSMGSS